MLLFPALPEDDAARVELMSMPQYKVAAMIDNQFSGLTHRQPDKPAYMDVVNQAISQLLTHMAPLSVSARHSKHPSFA
jgi:type VI secretion system protein ImpL